MVLPIISPNPNSLNNYSNCTKGIVEMTNKGMAAIKSANKKEEQIISIPQY